jgi:hypothetical protein
MVTLSAVHWIYIVVTVVIIAALLMKKEIVLPCMLGIFILGLVYSKDVITSLQIFYNAVFVSAVDLLDLSVIIALITAMSKCLAHIGADELMIRPLGKFVHSKKSAFFVIGTVMLIFSWFLWPSPAVALIGALLLPVALKAGLPAIWAAVVMNIFGHGVGLSSDYFIQGAPSITAKAAGVTTPELMLAVLPIWAVMCAVTLSLTYLFFLKDMKAMPAEIAPVVYEKEEKEFSGFARLVAILTPLAFIADIAVMIIFKIVGGDATALVGGTALLLICFITLFNGNLLESIENLSEHFKGGFQFAMRIFAPVIIIAAFFFMGKGDVAARVLGEGAPNILHDIGMALSQRVPLSKVPIAVIETIVAIITGLDGSGFSGLPMCGSIASTFAVATGIKVTYLAALGQIVTVWVGGGTIIPWGVIPVAAICDVKAADLARKNFIPVMCGIVAATIFTIFLI